ncbi:MAG: BRO family protein [Nostoc sp.]|uniref:BRO family protein n=1 Tax=Nostoc sp. TaxID=1180 RepID=UPI002FFCDFBE
MDAIIKRENQPSPFDQIKQVDTDSNEYWLARELMPILGYQQWRQFEDAISRAIAACSNIEQESEKHFLRLTAKSTGGRPRDDFKLSRYGCYLTAMNGDPRKPEIAAAQSYFVVKTREAETQTQLKAMTQIQLLAALAQQLAEQEQHLLQQQQQQTQILARLKAVEVEQDRVNTPCGHKYSVVGFANLQGLEIWSLKPNKTNTNCIEVHIYYFEKTSCNNSHFSLNRPQFYLSLTTLIS